VWEQLGEERARGRGQCRDVEAGASHERDPRVSDPAETAAVIAFLASPAASYITGAVIDSNGGYTA
jgi:NAD(P)-dependent dehydrogenase (short-subunit alcohol dehydrogenase family)